LVERILAWLFVKHFKRLQSSECRNPNTRGDSMPTEKTCRDLFG
jgi:hypothetical protein